MPSISVDIEVWCADCGEGICDHVDTYRTQKRDGNIVISPCSKCIGKKDDEISDLRSEIESLNEIIEMMKRGDD